MSSGACKRTVKIHGKLRPGPGNAVHGQSASVDLGDTAAEREAQAKAFAAAGGVPSVKRLHDQFQLILRDAAAVVPNGQDAVAKTDFYPVSPGLRGVFAEVYDQHGQQVGIACKGAFFGKIKGEPGNIFEQLRQMCLPHRQIRLGRGHGDVVESHQPGKLFRQTGQTQALTSDKIDGFRALLDRKSVV